MESNIRDAMKSLKEAVRLSQEAYKVSNELVVRCHDVACLLPTTAMPDDALTEFYEAEDRLEEWGKLADSVKDDMARFVMATLALAECCGAKTDDSSSDAGA